MQHPINDELNNMVVLDLEKKPVGNLMFVNLYNLYLLWNAGDKSTPFDPLADSTISITSPTQRIT